MIGVAGAAVAAPPHVISEREHPFDPDWLEVRALFNVKCVGCHRRNSDRYNFSTYQSLIDAGREDGYPVIVPGRPEQSTLWEYVSWNANARVDTELPDTPYMPEDKTEWLTPRQLNLVHRWITNGAMQYRLPGTCNISPLNEVDFPSAKECKACHPRYYDEWSRSMHAYSQQSPIFEALNLTIIERTAGTIGTFCTRCHTPIGTTLGENESVRNVNRSRIAREGVTCIVCHRRVKPSYKASGRIYLQPGAATLECVYGPFESNRDEKFGSHPSARFPYLKKSQFCGECHDVTSPTGVRLEEAFSEWHNSPAAVQGVTCQHCHMGEEPGRPIRDHERPLGYAATVPGVKQNLSPLRRLSTHTFVGPDYNMLPDAEFPEKLDWMYEFDYRDLLNLTPYRRRTLDDLRRKNRRSNELARIDRYRLLRNAARIHVNHPSQAASNSLIHVRVEVESLTAGHSFPTGFTAERQAWISIEVLDPAGQRIFASGYLDSNLDLCDNHSHDVLAGKLSPDRLLFNLQNKFVALGHKGTELSVVLAVNRNLRPINFVRPSAEIAQSMGHASGFRIAKYSLPPLKSRAGVYPIRLPATCGYYRLIVQLNFRQVPPVLLDRIGTPHLKKLLEIVVIDSYEKSIWVGSQTAQRQLGVAR
jgi:RNase P subunit RPR2